MTPSLTDGNVGTNGNYNGGGAIHGTLSTPRTGVGNCAAGAVTGADSLASVDGGLTALSQPVTFPTPPAPSPLPPTTNDSIQKNSGCPAGASYCVANDGVGVTITPPTASTVVELGNVSASGGATIHLSAGVYVINSISLTGGSTIVVDSGPIVFKVAGVGTASPIDLGGGVISNPSYNPSNIQFIYGGTGTVSLTGNAATAATVLAPNAAAQLNGTGDFYGALIAKTVSGGGNSAIHYDRNLMKQKITQGNAILHQFSWSSY
jgi:hypothetical protein